MLQSHFKLSTVLKAADKPRATEMVTQIYILADFEQVADGLQSDRRLSWSWMESTRSRLEWTERWWDARSQPCLNRREVDWNGQKDDETRGANLAWTASSIPCFSSRYYVAGWVGIMKSFFLASRITLAILSCEGKDRYVALSSDHNGMKFKLQSFSNVVEESHDQMNFFKRPNKIICKSGTNGTYMYHLSCFKYYFVRSL